MTASGVRRGIVAVLGLCLLALTLGTPSSANEVPWRDLTEATRQLDAAKALLADVDNALSRTDRDIAATAGTMGFVIASESDRLTSLELWRERSRRLAVESYINGGPAQTSLYLLNADGAFDLTYRNALLRDQAITTLSASRTYATLAANSDGDLVTLAETIEGFERRVEGLEEDRIRAVALIESAEWVVTIAEIHALADAEFEQNGRRDPTIADWQDLAFCESTNTYDINTGNGFYGAYQFDYQTWFTVGGEPGTRADQASPEEQDARARLLYSRRGSQPWPECGWRLDS